MAKDELEETFVALEAYAAPGGQRVKLLTSNCIRYLCTMERRDVARFATLMLKLSGWKPLPDLKRLMRDAKSKNADLVAKEKNEADTAARLEAARDSGRPLIASGMPVKIAKDFIAQRHPHLVYLEDEFLDYAGTCYRGRKPGEVRSLLQKFCDTGVDEATGEDYVPNRKELDDVMDGVRNFVYRDKTAYKPPSWLETDGTEPSPKLTLALRNGLLDMKERILMKHSWTFFTTNGLEYNYNPEAECPTWLDFLERNWPGDTETHEAVQEIFGYILTGDTSLQKMFAFLGPPRSGKGTLNRVLQALVGIANHIEKSLTDLRQPFGLAEVVGKSLLTVSDLRLEKGVPTGRVIEIILNLVGEDTVGINRKFKDMMTARLHARLVFFGNMDLHLPDISGALAARLIPIIMTKSWLGQEDPALTDKLLRELPGILNWALGGVDRLYERGHFKLTKAGAEHVHSVMVKASPVLSFLRQCTEDGDGIAVGSLFAAFEGWYREQGFKPWHSQEKFMDEVMGINRLVEAKRRDIGEGKRALCFTALALKPEYIGRTWESDEDDDGL